MSTPLLATKLYLPSPRPDVVPRPCLIARLDEGLHRPLTLVAAPAGFGKTMLVGEWVAGCQRSVAWLSLDAGDNDPARFLAYLIAALQTIAPHIGAGVSGVLQSPRPPPTESLLTALLNEVAALPDPFVLVLDDYHVIDAKPVDDVLTFLIQHLPPKMHLVIATREDPQMPLARLRAQGKMTDLRAADLRFTATEAAVFLNQVMGLDLSPEDITALESRTEGWIAGLQLAALSLRGREDVPGFIRAFAGDHRYIADYLVEEVLRHQPERVRSFLLQTAILERLSGPLCDAVTGQGEGSARLEALERGNFFVVPLDDTRHWYRYHHLFAEVLHAHLQAEQPEQVATLHRRASAWYAQHGSVIDAIRHALAAADFDRAADLVELAWPAIRRSRQEATFLGWLQVLPDEVVYVRPVLGVAYAHALLASGASESVDDCLRDAESWLDMTSDLGRRPDTPAAGMVVVDEKAFRGLPGSIAIARAGQALARGDIPETMKHARRALDLVPEDDQFRRGGVAAFLGLAYWTSGNLEAAHRSYAEGMAHLQRSGYITDAVGGAIALADIRIAQGRLREAMGTYERGLRLATKQGAPVLRGTADMYVGMSEIHRERDNLDAARQDLLRSEELGEHLGFPQHPYRRRVAMARLREAQGDPDGALELLDEAERRYVSDFYPNVRPVAAMKARVWVAQGRVGEALGWARERGLSAGDELSYLRECEHITLARLLLARHDRNRTEGSIFEAMGLLERLLHAAEAGGRTGSAIEILVLQALANQMRGDIPAALAPLERALKLAEPEGYVRTFVGEGAPMAGLLSVAPAQAMMPDYLATLLAAFATVEAVARSPAGEPDPPPASSAPPLSESLSQREMDVLRLIAQGLSNHEISGKLFLALDTVKGHNRRIFGKLQVQRRTEAIARARALGLL